MTDHFTLYLGHQNPMHPSHHARDPIMQTHDATAAVQAFEHAKTTAEPGEIITLYRNGIPERRIQLR